MPLSSNKQIEGSPIDLHVAHSNSVTLSEESIALGNDEMSLSINPFCAHPLSILCAVSIAHIDSIQGQRAAEPSKILFETGSDVTLCN